MSGSEGFNSMSGSEGFKSMTRRHPSEADIALLAGGDCSWLQRLLLNRHVARCGDCSETVASYSELRSEVRDCAAPGLTAPEWNRMAVEMRANIRLGLAAGECVGEAKLVPRRNGLPQLAVGMAGILLLAGTGVFLRGLLPHENATDAVQRAVLESTVAGPEVQTATGASMTLLNHGNVAADRTVTAQGAIQSSYVDAGVVTVARVYGE